MQVVIKWPGQQQVAAKNLIQGWEKISNDYYGYHDLIGSVSTFNTFSSAWLGKNQADFPIDFTPLHFLSWTSARFSTLFPTSSWILEKTLVMHMVELSHILQAKSTQSRLGSLMDWLSL